MDVKNFTIRITMAVIAFTAGIFTSSPAMAGGDGDFTFSDEAQFIPAIIRVNDGDIQETIAYLESIGIRILYNRDELLLTYIPTEAFSDLRRSRRALKVDPGVPRRHVPTMDDARNFYDAVKINEGVDLPMAYDGSGVVVGVCDIGIDTRHPNFLTADGRECRIRKMVVYREEEGLRTEYNTPEEIYEFETDNDDEYHATHVTGIAAGAYPNGYQSLAPSADIVFTASQLSDVGLLAGVEDIIRYAREVGKPAVVNLSMGNVIGPRDGTSLFTQYLDRCAEDAVICISAGNDGSGDEPKGLRYDFTEKDKRIEVQTTDWAGLHNRGIAEVWSSDDTPFLFSFYLHHDTSKARNIYDFVSLDFSDPAVNSWRISADPEDPDYNEVFGSHFFAGYISVTGGHSPLNGRFYVTMEFDCETEEYSPTSSDRWALYWPGVVVEGSPGTHVDIHCGGGGSFLRGERTFKAPGPDLSISDLATGFKTISIGMTNNKSHETLIDGTVKETGYPAEGINRHSSYGTLVDGRVLPLTCAPGSMVVSSMSGAFLRKYPASIPYMNAEVDYNGGKAYWTTEIGTSMATPYVAGAIATWLQAKPDLTSEEAVQLVIDTNRNDYVDADNPRNGRGWFDAYAGLQELTRDIMLGVEKDRLEGIAVKCIGGVLYYDNLTGGEIRVRLTSLAGISARDTAIPEGRGSVSLQGLDSGVYIVSLESGSGLRKVEKIFVR